jgi:tetraacyldisaccharide 4'-kinase
MSPDAIWYEGHWLSHLLWPLSWVYSAVVRVRRLAYRRGWLAGERLPVPVVVVGNLTVGGTGKTPLTLWLVDFLRRRGLSPGIVIRGHGGTARDWPRRVPPDGDPFELGDEPVLLARRSGVPVAAGPDRVAAARLLLGTGGCDILVSDDGLQHYRLQRDLEILVVDAARGLGNGRCLPAGPLREPQSRLRQVDLVVCNGAPCLGGEVMTLVPGPLTGLRGSGRTRDLAELNRKRVTAVAGIGNPQRYFALLRRHGLHLDERPYPDHHKFTAEDAATWPPGPVIMTEKDAVKCAGFAGPDHWYLPVQADLSPGFERQLLGKLKGLIDG